MSVLSELRMKPPERARWAWDASVRARLVLAAVVISTLLIGANLATPLYPLLQAELGITSFEVTVAFSAYVVTLVVGLLMVGHWSDHVGRRAALVLAIVIGFAGAGVFGAASSLPMLVLGRCLQGASVALATGASSAALRDLLPHRPDWASRFTLLASAGGVAAGPVIGGLLSLLPDPTRTPFALYSLVLVGLLLPLLTLKARPAIRAADTTSPFKALRPRRPVVSRAAGRAFWNASAVGFLSFAVFGFTLSLAPTYFASLAGTDYRPLIGLLAALVLGSSALSQLMRVRGRHVVTIGLTALGLGVALIPVAGMLDSVILLVLACLLAGAGQGIAFRTVFNEVALKVEPSQHSQIISTLYVLTYLGSAAPVVGLGAAVHLWGLDRSVTGFAAVIALASVLLAAGSLRRSLKSRLVD
ncbi:MULTISPECIES: MFS transporter [unclassified Arthrobacter]|uniref:MFS transporter n=1 Tax=unclassified Arthrobacter TaxID=235627 RepID=UPI0014910E85|nr:MFS transporter [Arthrobacter sp. AET 35A]MBE0008878.1 MFS transporter [Arthrobacter sp. AET 35A]NOJ62642.1 MFS transporter [Arthrobacter sp. 147(2020)]